MEWTAGQREVLAHGEGWMRVHGPAASGRTSVLVERWRQRAETLGSAEGVLVLCRSADDAERFRQVALAGGRWAVETLPVTTAYGLAFDLLRRAGDERRLLSSAERWALVHRMLAAEGEPARWPSGADLVRRPAFVEQVVAALGVVGAAGATAAAVRQVAAAWDQGTRWDDLLAFKDRFDERVRAMGAVDGPQLLLDAAATIEGAPSANRWEEVLVDDADSASAPMGRLVAGLAPRCLIAAGDETTLGAGPRWQQWAAPEPWSVTVCLEAARAAPTLLSAPCRHSALEAEEVAAQLLAAHSRGVPWRDMAVLARRAAPRLERIARTLRRYAIPVGVVAGSPTEEPAVRAIIDFFAWALGDGAALQRLAVSPAIDLSPIELRALTRRHGLIGPDLPDHPTVNQLVALRKAVAAQLATGDPGDVAYQVWIGLFGALVPDPDTDVPGMLSQRALGAVADYLAGISRRCAQDRAWRIVDEIALVSAPEIERDPWVASTTRRRHRPGDDDVVTLTTISAAQGRSWDIVVVAGCLEGELPAVSDASGYFDPLIPRYAALGALGALADGAVFPVTEAPGLAGRRAISLARESRLFHGALARGRAVVVGVAAPAPGQIASRFVAPLVESAVATGSWATGRLGEPLAVRLPTDSPVPVAVSGTLDLSATRLKEYEDCPLRYFYQYGLGVRGPGGVAASIGTVVHAALARFLDPDVHPAQHDWQALEAIAEQLWWGSGWSDAIAPYQPLREQARREIFSMLEDWWQIESSLAEVSGWPDVLAVEYPFELVLGGHRVRGVIDRVDRVAEGIAIVDYKTGSKVPPSEDVADDLQLALYHLAAARDPVLGSAGPPVSLRLQYLRKKAVVEQPIRSDHAERTERRVLEIARRILAEEFDPSVTAECEYCDFWRLCPLQAPGRMVSGE